MKKNINSYCAMGVLFAGSMASAADVKVSGFVAPGYMWQDKAPAANTFGVMDGSLNIGASMDMVEAFVEIPFMSAMTYNNGFTNGVANTNAIGSSTTGSNFGLAMYKAQAYVGHKWENGFNYRIGQWQAPFGYEGVDATDRVLAAASMLRATMLPTTQTGLTVGYDFSDMLGVNLFWTNHANQGISGTKSNGLTGSAITATSDKYDFGFKIASKLDTFKAAVGFLWERPADSVNNILVDVVAGTTFGKLGLDLDLVFDKLTNVDSMFGVSVQGTYGVTDMISAAVRVEWMKSLGMGLDGNGVVTNLFGSTTGTPSKDLNVSVGPQFAATKNLNVRVDYTYSHITPSAGDTITSNGVDVAAVYKF